jgi:hypothetical protein
MISEGVACKILINSYLYVTSLEVSADKKRGVRLVGTRSVRVKPTRDKGERGMTTN